MPASRYQFRDFHLDPAARELRRNGELVALPVSAVDCLAYLVEHRERAVGRDELIAAVWGRTDVADTLLAQTVLRIRRALGESGSEQSSIRTVPRFGYRWAAEVRIDVEETAGDAPGELGPIEAPVVAEAVVDVPAPPPLPARRGRRVAIPALVLLLVILGSVLAWQAHKGPGPAADAERVAAYVLPAQVPEAAEWSWLRLGLMDLVAGRLRAGGLATAPSESVLAVLRQAGSGAPAFSDALEIAPGAQFRGGQWQVTLEARHGSERLRATAESTDVLGAARSVADQLLIQLGHQPPPASGAPAPLALQELLQRTRAAILSDQFELARSLVAQAPPESRASPEVALRLVQIEMGEGRYESAQQHAAELLDGLPRDADPSLRGRILNLLGGAQVRTGRSAEADASYTDALEALRPVDDPIGRATAHAGRAAIAAQEGDLERATAELGQARVGFAAAADVLGVAHIDMNLGLVAAQRYRTAQALPMLREAEQRLREVGAREEAAYARYAMIGVQLQLLELAAARTLSDQNWPPEAHTGNERLRWQLVFARAQVLAAEGRLGEASALLERLARDASPTLDAAARQLARALEAQIAFERGNPEQAATMARSALTPSLQHNEPDIYLSTWRLLARALRDVGRLEEAATETAALRAWVEERPSEWRQLQAVLAEAEQAWAEGKSEAALATFDEASRRADRLGVPEDRVEVVASAVPAWIASARLDRASAAVGTIATWADSDFRAASTEARLLRALGRTEEWQRASERAAALARARAWPVLVPGTAGT
ncbi:winged helix-turn-helix domain-containing protein [Dokdonella sp.]|uniref:winged helix-turn-helix domain-containing protein n=1 Tax=Dokdonella sp. TaxID=2291710 RepID=UPI0026112C07|nr:winged helix-turn-helix domain-containing protein [Dokdonella sp.]